MSPQQVKALLTGLERWYRASARDLPWRVGPSRRDAGEQPDPYAVWLSEVMLQQTTVPHAAPYFLRFLKRWPTVAELAAAPWDEVSAAWAGLGYYSRARSLHACAQAVATSGNFPQDRDGLIALPGVGPYTAAAIAAIAFDQPVAPVDGNIERVLSRLHAIGSDATEAGWRAAKKLIAAQAQVLFDASAGVMRPGDLAQALMDLGASVCTPRNPACDRCPLAGQCHARAEGRPDHYPVKPAKKAQPTRRGAAFVAIHEGCVLLVRRPPVGLLGGMLMPPSTDWIGGDGAPDDAPPAGFAWRRVGEVRHVFTHFALKLDVWRGAATGSTPDVELSGAEWLEAEHALASLPTVGRKAVKLALTESG